MNMAMLLIGLFVCAICAAYLLGRKSGLGKAAAPGLADQDLPAQKPAVETRKAAAGSRRWYGNQQADRPRLADPQMTLLAYREELHKLIALAFYDLLDMESYIRAITYSSEFYSPELISKAAFTGHQLKLTPLYTAAYFMRLEDGSLPLLPSTQARNTPEPEEAFAVAKRMAGFCAMLAAEDAYLAHGSGTQFNQAYLQIRSNTPFAFS